ncbi:MAG: DUF218 domain-containing protein [Clostridiales bacterium]|nr:DUF218 domain-containing protein [Clostridiales bacterium]
MKKNQARRPVLRAIALILLAGILLAGGVNVYVCLLGGAYFAEAREAPQADAIIVPGALVWGDTPSHVLRDRLDTALELYEAGVSDRILVSGDHGRTGYDEVNVMRGYLMDRGVPEEHIFMDHAGFDTWNTMIRARDIFCVERCVIATNKYHLFRAVYLARRLGIKAWGVYCQGYIPAQIVYYQIREAAARCKDFLLAEILRPDPVYGGESIPISGDGRATQDGKS